MALRNWGYECLCYAMRGLKRIEDTSLYDLLADTYYDVLEKFKNDTRLTAYWDIPEYLTDEDEKHLDITDTQFYETECENFTKMAYEYINYVTIRNRICHVCAASQAVSLCKNPFLSIPPQK